MSRSSRGVSAVQSSWPAAPQALVLTVRGALISLGCLALLLGMVGRESVVCTGVTEAWTCTRHSSVPLFRAIGWSEKNSATGPMGITEVSVTYKQIAGLRGYITRLSREGRDLHFPIQKRREDAEANRVAFLQWVRSPEEPLVIWGSKYRIGAVYAFACLVFIGLLATLYEHWRLRRS